MAETRVAEIGSSASTAYGYWPDVDEYLDKLKSSNRWTVYRKMRSDAQVAALLAVLQRPIETAEFWIDPPDNSREAVEIGEYVWQNLTAPGEMDPPWVVFVQQALSCIAYGVSLFEVVYRREGELYKFRRFGQRLPWTITEWRMDEHGDLTSVVQQVPGTNRQVVIPRWRLMVFTFRREGSNWLGRPILRDVYQHWFYKNELYKFAGIAAERLSVGVPSMRVPADVRPGTNDWEEVKKIVKRFRVNEEAGLILPEGYEFEVLGGDSRFPFRQMIDHHNRMIVQAALAQFLSLGESGVGTYSLSRDQSELFLMGLRNLADIITEEVTVSAIIPLVRMNWGESAPVPKLRAKPNIQDAKMLADVLGGLTKAGVLTPDDGIENIVRSQLGFPERGEVEVRREGRSNAGSTVSEDTSEQ